MYSNKLVTKISIFFVSIVVACSALPIPALAVDSPSPSLTQAISSVSATPTEATPTVPAQQAVQPPPPQANPADQQDTTTGENLYTQFKNNQLTCGSMNDDVMGKIGQYAMEKEMGPANHIQVNQMIKQLAGDTGEQQLHIAAGKNVTGCNAAAGSSILPSGIIPPDTNTSVLGASTSTITNTTLLQIEIVGLAFIFFNFVLTILLFGKALHEKDGSEPPTPKKSILSNTTESHGIPVASTPMQSEQTPASMHDPFSASSTSQAPTVTHDPATQQPHTHDSLSSSTIHEQPVTHESTPHTPTPEHPHDITT